MKKLALITLILVLACAGAAAWWVNDLSRYAESPEDPSAAPRLIVIPPGMAFRDLVALLQQNGIVRHPLRFRWLARRRGADKKIQAGEYLLAGADPPRQILATLAGGNVYLHRLTVPEGYSLTQIAEVVAAAGLGDRAAFLQAAADRTLLRKLKIEAETLEGYLYPDTYLFPRGDHARGYHHRDGPQAQKRVSPPNGSAGRRPWDCPSTRCSPWHRSSRRRPGWPRSAP